MKYIAYGSNLNLKQMACRCPGAKVLYNGIIKDYILVFRGSKTGAYATIIPKKGQYVPVTVWEIDEVNEIALDRYEGYPTFYYKRLFNVHLDNGDKIKAMAYIMFDEALPGRPTMTYLHTCLQGYIDNKLDVGKFKSFVNYNNKEMHIV